MTGLIADNNGLVLAVGGLFLETALGSATLAQGAPFRIVISGVVYERLQSQGGDWLYSSNGEPLYGRIS